MDLSKETGLALVMEAVREGSPAWNSGVRWCLGSSDVYTRPGDAIVTVDGWLITLMDQPKVGSSQTRHQLFQVACSLFEAGCNMVRLGIQKGAPLVGPSLGPLGVF